MSGVRQNNGRQDPAAAKTQTRCNLLVVANDILAAADERSVGIVKRPSSSSLNSGTFTPMRALKLLRHHRRDLLDAVRHGLIINRMRVMRRAPH